MFSPNEGLIARFSLPIYYGSVRAGLPSLPDDGGFNMVDLNSYLVPNPQSTFGLRAYGESMVDGGIDDGDLLIVEQGVVPRVGDICIFRIDSEYTVKRFVSRGRKLWLVPANKSFKRTEIKPDQECEAWGVVRWILKRAS